VRYSANEVEVSVVVFALVRERAGANIRIGDAGTIRHKMSRWDHSETSFVRRAQGELLVDTLALACGGAGS